MVIGSNRMDLNPPRLAVPLTRQELTEIAQLAHQAQTSPGVLAQVFIRQMLAQARAGALPLVPPSRVADAIEVGTMGLPLTQIPPLPGSRR